VPAKVDTLEDIYGNEISYFSIDEPHKQFTVTVNSTLTTQDNPVYLPVAPSIEELTSTLLHTPASVDLLAIDCLLPSPYVPSLAEVDSVISQLQEYKGDALAFSNALMEFIYREFEFDSHFSTLVTPISAVLEARRGVCQDFAHLALAVLRRAGIPARYVSGYLETLPPPGQQKLQGADASHAWFAVYIPNMGWYDFDPTNNKRPDGQYVTTAWGRDYADVAPLKGVIYGGGTPSLTVSVDVNRVITT
jgi:transglutaminase-like putative cysteine protease